MVRFGYNLALNQNQRIFTVFNSKSCFISIKNNVWLNFSLNSNSKLKWVQTPTHCLLDVTQILMFSFLESKLRQYYHSFAKDCLKRKNNVLLNGYQQ
jgi:hypothetical protein